MAAPCFCTPESLRADLSTLGYPDAHAPDAVSPNGPARLHTLYWLACLIDPDYDEDPSDDALAAFWEQHGLQSHPKNSAGHRVPLTVPADKQRDRNAAAVFLRAAVDLAMAFCRRRELGLVSEQPSDEEPEMNQEDIDNDRVLVQMIHSRHVLFPSTVTMFAQVEVKKRRPLIIVKKDNNGTTRIREQGKQPARAPETREQILNRLRQLQRETHDLRHEHRARTVDPPDDNPAPMQPDLTEQQLDKFARDCQTLTARVAQFDTLAREALRVRDQRTDLATRDETTEHVVNAVAEECEQLECHVRTTFDNAARLRAAVSRLQHGRGQLEGLVYSSGIEAVRKQRIRVEAHL